MEAHFSEMHMDQDFLVNQAVKRASEAAEQTGEVSFDQLNALLPSDKSSPELIEEVLSRLAEEGIRVVDK
jgi:RNA polymerase primary sigma factor